MAHIEASWDFHLIVSTGRGLEPACISAIREILAGIDPHMSGHRLGFSGLVAIHLHTPPREAVKKIATTLVEKPWYNDLIKRVVPIDRVVATRQPEIISAVDEIRGEAAIRMDESFRVKVRRRGSDIDRISLIMAVADLFVNRVDLENPDLEVRIEILGEVSGISVIRRGEIFPDL